MLQPLLFGCTHIVDPWTLSLLIVVCYVVWTLGSCYLHWCLCRSSAADMGECQIVSVDKSLWLYSGCRKSMTLLYIQSVVSYIRYGKTMLWGCKLICLCVMPWSCKCVLGENFRQYYVYIDYATCWKSCLASTSDFVGGLDHTPVVRRVPSLQMSIWKAFCSHARVFISLAGWHCYGTPGTMFGSGIGVHIKCYM